MPYEDGCQLASEAATHGPLRMILSGNRVSIRTAVVAALSALVVLASTAFIMSPVAVTLADEVRTTSIPSKSTVFYGKVTDTGGEPISKARVVVYHYSRGRQHIDAVMHTAKNGTYRKVLRLHGRVYVQISVKTGKRTVVSRPRRLDVSTGHAYRVSARLVRRTVITFLPIFSY